MRKLIGIAALAGLPACVSSENFYQEVAESNSYGNVIRTNIGNMDHDSDMIALIRVRMDGEAIKQCRGDMELANERISTASAYYTWLERSYRCK